MNRSLIVFAVLLASASATAASPVGQVRLFGHRIAEEGAPGPARVGQWVIPNELEPFRFDRAVRGRAQHGDVLAVGTYRGLHIGAAAGVGDRLGRPDAKTYLLDVDAGVRHYNHSLLQVVSDEQRRGRFVERALGELDRSRGMHGLGYVVRAAGVERTIFGSDALYGDVRRGVRRGAYVPVLGSLSGDRTLVELGDVLRRTGRKLAVIDVSNALDYMQSPEARAAFTRNLRSLPLSDDALLLTTDEAGRYNRDGSRAHWEYFVLRASDYLDAWDRGLLSVGQSHFALYNRARLADQRVDDDDAIEPRVGFNHVSESTK